MKRLWKALEGRDYPPEIYALSFIGLGVLLAAILVEQI